MDILIVYEELIMTHTQRTLINTIIKMLLVQRGNRMSHTSPPPQCAIHEEYLSKIWLESRLLCLIYRHLGIYMMRHRTISDFIHKTRQTLRQTDKHHNTSHSSRG